MCIENALLLNRRNIHIIFIDASLDFDRFFFVLDKFLKNIVYILGNICLLEVGVTLYQQTLQ